MKKRTGFLALLTLTLALAALSGCSGLSFNPQDLYALPELPAKYTELRLQINAVLNEGAEYAAPTSGANIQPVQLVDLDGDGREEAVAFFRNSGEDKPLKICVFTAEGDSYRLSERIEGSGTAVHSVAYTDMEGDGLLELAVGWKATAELQVLEIYSPAKAGNTPLVRTDYVKYAAADLDGDRRLELVVFRAGEGGDSVADYYSWQKDGTLSNTSSARISATMAELSQQGRVRPGALEDATPALFVTGVTDDSMAVTDILALRGGEIANIVLDQATGVSGQIASFCSLYPGDVNGDGVTEVPRPVPVYMPWDDSGYQQIEWCSYDAGGAPSVVMRTYHDMEDGWYLRLPETWDGKIYVSRTALSGEASVTFYVWGRSGEASQPFLRVSTLTGTGREIRSARGERFILSHQLETIYTAELPEGGGNWEFTPTEDEVRAAFSLITQEWLFADN